MRRARKTSKLSKRPLRVESLERRILLTLPPSYVADVRIDIDYSMSIVVDGQTSTMSETLGSRTMPLLSNPSEYQQLPDGELTNIGPLKDNANFEFENGSAELSGRNELAFFGSKPGLVNDMWVHKNVFGDANIGSPVGNATTSIDVQLTVLPNENYPAGTPIQLLTIINFESRDSFECHDIFSNNCEAIDGSSLSLSADARFLSNQASNPFVIDASASANAFLFDIGGPRTTAFVGESVTLRMEHSISGSLVTVSEFRQSRFHFNVLQAAPPPNPEIQIVRDEDTAGDGYLVVNDTDPVTDYVRIGIWDNAYQQVNAFDQLHSVKNAANEADNFVGSDRERFYFRVVDSVANTDPDEKDAIKIEWYTATELGDDVDREGNTLLTLIETEVNSGVFVSKAVMLVAKSLADVDGSGEADDIDWFQSTHNGFGPDDGANAPAAAQVPNAKENHRTRRATIGSQVIAIYAANWPGSEKVTTSATVFKEEERRYLPLHVISFLHPDTGVPLVSDSVIEQHLFNAQDLWLPAAITLRPTIQYLPFPRDAIVSFDNTNAFSSESESHRQAMAKFLVDTTTDGSLVVAFGFNLVGRNPGQTWIFNELAAGIGNRGFVYMSQDTQPKGNTLAHELFHALYNREDIQRSQQADTTFLDVQPHYFTFNKHRNTDYNTPSQQDVRVRRRFHPHTIGWETLGGVWSHRTLLQRFEPKEGPAPPADETTGNVHFGDADLGLTIDNDFVVEGHEGFTELVFNVTLSGGTLQPVTVEYATRASSAHYADNDYVRSVGTLTFGLGETSKTISVSVLGDDRIELDETLFVDLANARGAIILDGTGFGVIFNDDQDRPVRPWQNTTVHWDVSNNGCVTSLDALLIINYLASVDGETSLGPREDGSLEPFFDVNGDGKVSSLDALDIMNRLLFFQTIDDGEERDAAMCWIFVNNKLESEKIDIAMQHDEFLPPILG